MDIKEINQFIDKEIERLKKYYDSKNDEELTLAMAIKIGEELGELYNELLAHKGYQRKDKLEKLDKEEIGREIADVLFTTLIIARRLNIDVEKAIKDKMNKINARNYEKI
jgi:NTP pyrophosphatase (non-canonical NTP hydrolase)